MGKKVVSSADLIWIFHEKIEEFDDCACRRLVDCDGANG
jgi:hypothetical protein